jgi:glyceraldehyde 3-phosphate dehydrogenase
MVKIAINGFGRIGRAALKIILERNDMELVAINDLADAGVLSHLLKHDTAYGTYQRSVRVDGASIVIDEKAYPVYSEPDPKKLPWKDLGVDVVLECTGRFNDGKAMAHVEAGGKKIILSAPAKDEGFAGSF